MSLDIFQINMLDWFAIWGGILIALILLMWFAREPKTEEAKQTRTPGYRHKAAGQR